jgi:hypothetical protein
LGELVHTGLLGGLVRDEDGALFRAADAADECVQQEVGDLWAAYCLNFAYYNFCRIHTTLRVTPAMEAGITGSVWTLADLMAA